MQFIKKKRFQKAFSMVETLVALVVLSVGLLGTAALYVTTLRSGGSAIARTQAVNLANDMVERIRANRTAGLAYGVAYGDPGVNKGCWTAACGISDMAANDIYTWKTQITASLPGAADGKIDYAAGTPATYTVEISWTDQGSASKYVLVAQI